MTKIELLAREINEHIDEWNQLLSEYIEEENYASAATAKAEIGACRYVLGLIEKLEPMSQDEVDAKTPVLSDVFAQVRQHLKTEEQITKIGKYLMDLSPERQEDICYGILSFVRWDIIRDRRDAILCHVIDYLRTERTLGKF